MRAMIGRCTGWLLMAVAPGCAREVCGVAEVGGGELTVEVQGTDDTLELEVPPLDRISREPDAQGAWMEIGPTADDLTRIQAEWDFDSWELEPCEVNGPVQLRLSMERQAAGAQTTTADTAAPQLPQGELVLDRGETRLLTANVFQSWTTEADRFAGSAELDGQWSGAACPELGSGVPVRVSWSFSRDASAIEERFYAGLPGSCPDRRLEDGQLEAGPAAGGCPDLRVSGAPHDLSFSTTLAGDDFRACGGRGSPDVAIEFTAEETAVYAFDASSSQFDAVLAVFDGCDQPVKACYRPRMELHLAKGTTVLVVVDGDDLEAGTAQVEIRRRQWSL